MNHQRTCPACGENMAEEVAVCPACGKPVPIAAPPPALPQDGVHKLNWWVDIVIFLVPFGMTLLASALVKEQAFVFGMIASAICSVFLGVRVTVRLGMPTLLKVFFGILFTAMFLVVNLAACLFFGCVYLGGKF